MLSLSALFASLCLAAGGLAHILEDPHVVQEYYVVESFSWPSASAWTALNDTLGGRLQALRPWAAVCYVDDPLYDAVKCQTVLSTYTNDYAREDVASALLWANWESCGFNSGCALNYSNPQPVFGETCHQGTTPPYSFAISSAQDASVIVKWATAHSVKLAIKNTGHDQQGRSASPSSLQVLTHNLKGVVYVADFVPQGSSAAPVPALTISAGTQLEEIYAVAEANDVSAVLGTCLTVSAAGGFIQGGGNSRLSPAHGLAADNLLEVEIVTADGVIRTINPVQEPDLFWAVRGGGAGSWGIVSTSFPCYSGQPKNGELDSSLTIQPDPTQDRHTLGVGFLALLGKYQNQIINAGIATTLAFSEESYSLTFFWPARHASVSLLYPFFDELRALSSNYVVLSNATQEFMYPSFSNAIAENVGPAVEATYSYGGSTEVASRFVPQSMLESPESVQNVAEAIWEGLQIATAPLEDYPAGISKPQVALTIFGDMPAATRQQVNETGANPGSYHAAWHVLYTGTWTVGASRNTYHTLSRAVYNAVGPLTALGVTSSYQNEGSAWETNWQEAFFGYKYDRLLQIKQKYDPTNFFTTYKGVGSESELRSAAYSCYEAYQEA